MKMKQCIVWMLAGIFIVSCKKDAATADAGIIYQPQVTAVGFANGAIVTASIGSAGGKIISSDGVMELIIPPGVLTANTAISIQLITNNAPNGRGNAYRCLPDGLTFSSNISIQFHYTDSVLAATKPEWMRLAFQNAGKYWQVLKNITNDTAAKIVSAQVNHFTDFAAFDVLHIYPPARYLKPNESGNFKIDMVNLSPEQGYDLIALVNKATVVWKLNGNDGTGGANGSITTDNAAADGGLSATYKAPAATPGKNPVTISAEVMGPFTIDGQPFNKAILLAQAFIIGSRYKVEIEYQSTINPSSDAYLFKDRGSYTINLGGGSGAASDIVNPDANLQRLSGNCTAVNFNGPGAINIRSVDFLSVAPAFNNTVYVHFNDGRTVKYPIFTISANCNGIGGTQDFGSMPSISGSVVFADNGRTQILDYSAAGITIIYTITAIP